MPGYLSRWPSPTPMASGVDRDLSTWHLSDGGIGW